MKTVKKREFRSYGLLNSNPKYISVVESKLDKANIPKSAYRINYFNTNVELVVEKSLMKKVRTTLS